MHPPYVGGTGYTMAVTEPIDLPSVPTVMQCEIGKGDGSDVGDGILFRVAVIEPDGTETLAAERQWDQHAWTDWQVDLSRWAGKSVQLKFMADVGEADNSSGDWAYWSNPRLETAHPVLVSTLHERPVLLAHEDGPAMPASVDVDVLHSATSGRIYFQGIGLQCGQPYVSIGLLNGVPIGPLPTSRGSESTGDWGAEIALSLNREAIEALREENRLTIENPGQDCFKIRRCWLELDLADGGKISSQVNTTVWTQPPSWLHAEGVRVPFGKPIEISIRFRAAK